MKQEGNWLFKEAAFERTSNTQDHPDKIFEAIGKSETHTASDDFCSWIRKERIPTTFYISPPYQTRYQLYVNSKMEVILDFPPAEWKNPGFWFRQLYPKDREKVL